jgi:heptosyltransferase-1
LRVLIIKLSAFGDIIHSLSVMDCFREYSRQYNREVEIDWLVEEKWAPILSDYPGIGSLITSDTKGWRKSLFEGRTWKEIRSFWSELRKKRYDLVIDINGLLRSALLARLARANERVGFSEDSDFIRERHSSLFLDRTFSVPHGHVVDQTVGLLEKILDISMPGPVVPVLPENNRARKQAAQLVSGMGLVPNNYAVIAAGGGWDTKLLKPALIALFCDQVAEYGIIPVLSCAGEAEKKRGKDIADMAESNVIMLEDIPVDLFIEVMRISRLVIGPDTGTVHAASAAGTPTVSYYGPSSGDYSGPRRSTDRVVQISPDCGPCFKRKCDKGLCLDLNIDKVLKAIREQLEK